MVSRPKKSNHLAAILYEIDMLNFCYGRLCDGKWADRREFYVHIEGFLLHYRNLIQFFGNKHDLKAGTPKDWSPKKLTEPELTSIQDRKPFNEHNGQISQYLSHLTKSRATIDRSWDHIAMYEQIGSLLENFRKLFPSTLSLGSRVVVLLSSESVSTATISSYDSLLNEFAVPVVPEPKLNLTENQLSKVRRRFR